MDVAGSSPVSLAIFFVFFSKRRKKITAKTINLKVASELALEIFYFCVVAFCMAQKA